MPTQEQLEIRSNEAGAFLLIQRDGPGSHDDLNDGYWMAALSCGPLQAALRFYEIELGGLADYFAALADDWRGWNGQRRWASLENDVELLAAHDGLGTITLTARLRTEAFSQHRWSAAAQLVLDAGGLERIARDAKRLL